MVRELAAQALRRMTVASVASNLAGALVVFVFATIVLPVPLSLHHLGRLSLINTSAFLVLGSIGMALGWRWSRRLWRERFAWAESNRTPTEREREQTLRYPLSQQKLSARLWGIAAIAFAALNAPFSGEVASDP